jgi:hypothetical protein
MPWNRLALAAALALTAAFAFYPVLRLGPRSRALAWLVCSTIVGLSPCLVPLTATPLRLLASLLAITLLIKLYDLYREAQLAVDLSLVTYLALLPNPFRLVLRKEPTRPPMIQDLLRLAFRVPAALLSVALCLILLRLDWSTVPFALEHVLKVSVAVSATVLLGNAAAAGFRLLGSPALDMMNAPLIASTPADFWRRWNLPVHQFLLEYVFLPAGGRRNPVRATLVTFAISGVVHEYVFGIASGRVQGCQFLFFMLQGVAAAATMRIRPRGPIAILWTAGTGAFNLVTSFLFFMSMNQVLPFYSLPDY